MDALAKQQELIASNLANLQSQGFRRSVLSFAERVNERHDPLNGTTPQATGLDFSVGTLQATGVPLDVALGSDGFFKVSGPQGTWYTRAGIFQRLPTGAVVNDDGFPVWGTNGPLTIDPQIPLKDISIDSGGNLSFGSQVLGKLAVVQFADNQRLIPHGQVYFEAPQDMAEEVGNAPVMQGNRELSNAQPVVELVNLIINSRMYEAAQRTVRTISEALQQRFRS